MRRGFLIAAILLVSGGQDSPGVRPNPCTIEGYQARCLQLHVPERPGDRAARRIPLNIVVLPRLGSGPAREPLFILHGGPGAAATALTTFAAKVFLDQRLVRDIVLVDQRGTGGSNRLDCPVAPGTFLVPFDSANCRARLSAIADLRAYTTDSFVADLDAVRAALGYERVALYGGSYGTRAAYVYARTHPSRVTALILVAPAPVSISIVDTFSRDARTALDALVRDCLSQPTCRAEHPTLSEDVETVRRTFTTSYQVLGLQFLQYSASRMSALAGSITAAARGDAAPLRDAIASARSGLVDQIDLGLHLSVMCSEEVPFATPPRQGEAPSAAADEYARACRDWPRAEIPPDFRRMTKLPHRALVIAGEWDPVTPPAMGQVLADHFSPGQLVVLSKSGHTLEAAGCLSTMSRDFLAGRPVDDRCAKR